MTLFLDIVETLAWLAYPIGLFALTVKLTTKRGDLRPPREPPSHVRIVGPVDEGAP